ncbi:MAG: sulfatase [Ktedonobacteraceae bacterium]
MNSRPDIVLLVLDTHRVDRLSCYGYPRETSPYLDAFAADSTLFRHAVSAAQWTIPSHSSMFTGLYPSSHNMGEHSSVLSPILPTLAERLRKAGYFTSGFSNNLTVGVLNNGLRRGFQRFVNYNGFLSSQSRQARINPKAFAPYLKLFKRQLNTNARSLQDTLAHSEALQNLSFPLYARLGPLLEKVLKTKGNTTKALTDAAQLLIERKEVDEGQPIFTFINLMGTHLPYHPPLHFLKRYASDVLRDKAARRYLNHLNTHLQSWMAPLTTDLDEQSKAILDGTYDAEVASQDEQVGAFLEKLRSGGALNRTLVIVCADHGEHLGEKQLMGHAFSIYNELTWVPLLIRDPGGDLPAGVQIEQFVSTRRIFHTVLAAAGQADPLEESLSLAQTSSAESDPDHGVVFSEAFPLGNLLHILQQREPQLVQEHRCDQMRRAVWKGEHKLIQVGDDHWELYNVFEDPNEKKNLYEALPEQVRAMQEHLQTFVSHAGVGAPTTDYTIEYEDPVVLSHLRNLGYLE